MTRPSWRKPAGIFGILFYIILWAVAVGSLAGIVGNWPFFVQAGFYLVAGIIWIAPLKPVLKWMETGHFRD